MVARAVVLSEAAGSVRVHHRFRLRRSGLSTRFKVRSPRDVTLLRSEITPTKSSAPRNLQPLNVASAQERARSCLLVKGMHMRHACPDRGIRPGPATTWP